jgi:hypothetical protein
MTDVTVGGVRPHCEEYGEGDPRHAPRRRAAIVAYVHPARQEVTA